VELRKPNTHTLGICFEITLCLICLTVVRKVTECADKQSCIRSDVAWAATMSFLCCVSSLSVYFYLFMFLFFVWSFARGRAKVQVWGCDNSNNLELFVHNLKSFRGFYPCFIY